MTELTAQDRELIEAQEKLFESLRASLIKNVSRKRDAAEMSKMADAIDGLRQSLRETREEDTGHVLTQIHVLTSLAEHKANTKIPDLNLPYFGFLRLQDDSGRMLNICIGERAYIDPEERINIVNWSESPFAEVFFQSREGDEYDVDLPGGGSATGRVLLRLVLSFYNGKLMRLDRAGVSLVRGRDAWVRHEGGASARLRGGEGATVVESRMGTGGTNVQSPIVKALLDPQQYRLIQESPNEPLLIIGSAGCGKTTVALHRLAVLHQRYPERFAQKSLLVIVPEKGLEALTRRLLDDLGLPLVKVKRLDDWMVREGRRLLKDLPKRVYSEAPALVRRFKGHRAFKDALTRYQERLESDLVGRLHGKRHLMTEKQVEAFAKAKHMPLLKRLPSLERKVLEQYRLDASGPEKVVAFKAMIKEEMRRFQDWNRDREEVFSDRSLLEQVVADSAGELRKEAVIQVIQHTQMQHGADETERYQGWAAESLETVDKRSLDADTPEEIANSIDVEDFPMLFHLLALRAGNLSSQAGAMRSYQHIVLDEAQEYSPVELGVVGQALTTSGSITVAGDAAQQTDPTSHFRGWDGVLDELGVKRVAAQKLTISYRSTRQIMAFAEQVLGPLAPTEKSECKKDGPEVKVTVTSGLVESFILIGDVLRELHDAEPSASIAVICENLETARLAYQRLQDIGQTRFVDDGDFTFKPGIDFTDAIQVKGLEFDYVIIPDANVGSYPPDPMARRKLHVAVTRGIHQVWLLTSGRSSDLVM